jgi:hypothetical protein
VEDDDSVWEVMVRTILYAEEPEPHEIEIVFTERDADVLAWFLCGPLPRPEC